MFIKNQLLNGFQPFLIQVFFIKIIKFDKLVGNLAKENLISEILIAFSNVSLAIILKIKKIKLASFKILSF